MEEKQWPHNDDQPDAESSVPEISNDNDTPSYNDGVPSFDMAQTPTGAPRDEQYTHGPYQATAGRYTTRPPYYQNNMTSQGAYRQQGPYQNPGAYPSGGYNTQGYQPPMGYHTPQGYMPAYTDYSRSSSAGGKATASLVLGIVSLVLSWFAFINILAVICGIVGIILGASARRELGPMQKGTATAGMVCSIIALVLSLLILLAIMFIGIFTSTIVEYNHGIPISM